jgi:hypothetical protein
MNLMDARFFKVILNHCLLAATYFALPSATAFAEVTNVNIVSRSIVADGVSFGASGPYEKLVGRIEFALDPSVLQNVPITDLRYAQRGSDRRVHFSADLYVLQPVEPAKGNGVLLFEVVNRGNKALIPRFNQDATRSDDPHTLADFGDGLLMKDGYTLVFVGWEFGLSAPELTLAAPKVTLPRPTKVDPVHVDIVVHEPTTEAYLVDEPARPPVLYAPLNPASRTDTLTVRDLYWDVPRSIHRDSWRFVVDQSGVPKVQLDGGFDPGRWYRVTYRPTGSIAAGVGLAAIRDTASAFRYRTDLPVRGRSAYVFGNSQTGRFLRQFLHDGFNTDERNRRVFDAVWAHIAGAARGSFNSRFATPSHGDMFEATRFPYSDLEQSDIDGTRDGVLSRYPPDQRPKIFYTNTPVEYWGGGRAAALTHTTVDGKRDLPLPDNVRIYLLAGTQHTSGPFPPPRSLPLAAPIVVRRNLWGQELSNPAPQINVMRGLLRALHEWVANGTPPPLSKYPKIADGTLVEAQQVKFPSIPGVGNPRGIVGPARIVRGKVTPLPYLIPQVDADGNDLAGIHDPEVAVPLATTTGWNFRNPSVGNPKDIYQTLGSYIPFAKSRAVRELSGDPRLSIGERYSGADDYMQRIRSAASELIQQRYMLPEDLNGVLSRARLHWNYATAASGNTN